RHPSLEMAGRVAGREPRSSTGGVMMMSRRAHLSAGPRPVLAAVAGLLLMTAGARATTFQTINNNADPTFNQLLGINNAGTIAGYFGSGTPAATHPNKGYTIVPPYGQANFTNENFPGSQ